MESANALSKQQNCFYSILREMSNTIHSRTELAVNGGVVASFACSCSLNCFAFSHRIRPPIGMHADLFKPEQYKAQLSSSPGGGGGNDVIFNYVIIEMASLDNPGVCITAWSVNK